MHIHNITKHCSRERIQQRGIPHRLIEMISIYGEVHRRPNHTLSLYFSKKSIQKMKNDGVDKKVIIEAQERTSMRFIVDEESATLITIIHADKNKQRVH
jgi:hypothetical protein